MKTQRKRLVRAMAVLVVAVPLSTAAFAGDPPETVELDSLANYYEPVSFDHAMHMEVAEDCAVCHHHTTGTPPLDEHCARCHAQSGPSEKVACRSCHPANRFDAAYMKSLEEDPALYHVGKPGLKGAFHRKCLGCHTDMGAPTGCQDCHARNEKGDAFFHSGKYAPSPEKTVHGGENH